MPSDAYQDSVLPPERVGAIAFATTVVVFTYLGYLLFDDVLFGGLVGLLVGGGDFLHLPYFMYRGAAAQGEVSNLDAGYAHRAAAGIGLSAAGIVALAGRFVYENATVGPVGIGLAIGLVVYVVLDRTLPTIDEGVDSTA